VAAALPLCDIDGEEAWLAEGVIVEVGVPYEMTVLAVPI